MICQNCQYLHILSKSIRFAKIHTICQNPNFFQNPHDLSKSAGNCLNPQGFGKICTIAKICNNCQNPQVFSKSSICQSPHELSKSVRFFKNLQFAKIRNFVKICMVGTICTICQNWHDFCFYNFSESAKIYMNCQNLHELSKSAQIVKINKFCQKPHDLPKSVGFLENL